MYIYPPPGSSEQTRKYRPNLKCITSHSDWWARCRNKKNVITKHLMTDSERISEFCFPRISTFPETKSRETSRFEGNKICCFPMDQSVSDLLYSFLSSWKKNLKTRRALEVNINRSTISDHVRQRVTVHCYSPTSKMLRAMNVWRETVCLLHVMWP